MHRRILRTTPHPPPLETCVHTFTCHSCFFVLSVCVVIIQCSVTLYFERCLENNILVLSDMAKSAEEEQCTCKKYIYTIIDFIQRHFSQIFIQSKGFLKLNSPVHHWQILSYKTFIAITHKFVVCSNLIHVCLKAMAEFLRLCGTQTCMYFVNKWFKKCWCMSNACVHILNLTPV